MANPIPLAFPDGSKSTTDIREYLSKAFPLIKLDAAEIQNEDYSETPYDAIFFGGGVFVYDSADTTTAHDGTTCLVSQDGRRYKVQPQSVLRYSVDDKDVSAQPASPSIGDAYLLPVAPTGDDWAAWAKHIVFYTARGWVNIAPEAGQIVYVEDEDLYYRHNTAGSWVSGLGSAGLGDGSVTTRTILERFGVVVTEERTEPPVSAPAANTKYIVGTPATGDFAGQENKIAIYDGSAYGFYDGYEGAQVFDEGLGLYRSFSSGAWVSNASKIVDIIPIRIVQHEYSVVAATGVDAVIFDIDIETIEDDAIFFDFREITVDIKHNAGSSRTVTASSVFLKRDTETEKLFEVSGSTPSSVAPDTYANIITGENIPVMEAALSSSSHTFKLMCNIAVPDGIKNARLSMSGTIQIIRNTIVTS